MDMPFSLQITRDPAAVRQAQALRHRVFVEEMGSQARGPQGLEADAYDLRCDHVILHDPARPDLGAVATLRLGYGEAGAFYTAEEFDLGPLLSQPRVLAEMGRTCLHPNYRGGMAAYALFQAMLAHLRGRGVGLLVGTASFPGADPQRHLPALRRVRQEALAPAHLRPWALGRQAISTHGTAPRMAMRDVPALIKTYLRAGAWVGEGAWVDRAFNTVDLCMVLDLGRIRLPRAVQIPAAMSS